MEAQENKILDIISKLMNEQEGYISPLRELYESLYSIVEEKLPISLDMGSYINNASIIRQSNKILSEKQIMVTIPELADRSIVAVWGSEKKVAKMFKQLSIKWLGIEFNTNLPLLMIPSEKYENTTIYAVTYMDKLVPISSKEYHCITQEIYKDNIDIRRLIKSFVIYFPSNIHHQVYSIMPEYVDTSNDYYQSIMHMLTYQILVTDEEGRWKKSINKLFDSDIYLFGSDTDLTYLTHKRKNKIVIKDEDEFLKLCEKNNVSCINFAITIEFQRLFLDVDIYYSKKYKVLKERIARLAKESINIQDFAVKKQVQKYRKSIIELQDELDIGLKSFEQVKDEIIQCSLLFEANISNLLMHTLPDNINSDRYKRSLLDVFFKSIYAEKIDDAKDIILRLIRANYEYSYVLTCFINYIQGKVVSISDRTRIKDYPDYICEISKIKLAMSEELRLSITEILSIISRINPLETGKEYYYFGHKLLYEKKYNDAANYFLKALDNDYDKAGVELIELAKKHPECRINIEELAENLVTEANYYIGKETISEKYKKGVVNLKMAASQNHVESIEMIADILFEKNKYKSWQDMKSENSRNAINNIINLYSFLNKKRPKEIYNLRIGLMYCKLNDYARAYGLLKNINKSEAQYECAKMHQYGNGVAKDLNLAKEHYERTDMYYRDTQAQYNKVCIILDKEKERKEQTVYTPTRNYSSYSTISSSSSSDFCFITTAACLALKDKKDCEQLNMLRQFRDTHILGDGEDGDDLVKEYYRIGPIIVRHIDSEWNPFAIYDELWQEYILPSCYMINQNMNICAKRTYIKMVKMLCEKYNVVVKKSIMNKYGIKINNDKLK